MKLYTDGIVTNEFNQALFIRRDDSRTWAQPGGAVERGETPTEALEREVEEETGLKVKPVRLVGLYYRAERPDGLLMFTFRCIQRGGELRTSEESPSVGFLPVAPLPRPMLPVHRERLERALRHSGGPPYWGRQPMALAMRIARGIVYGTRDLLRILRGQERFRPPPEWRVGAFAVVRDESDRVLWIRRNDHDVWNLPGGGRQGLEPPWHTAEREAFEETGLRVSVTDLSGVYTKPDREEVIFTFKAEVVAGSLRSNREAADFAYFAPGEEPSNTLPKHVQRVEDADSPQMTTIFRRQEGPSDLELLGLAQA